MVDDVAETVLKPEVENHRYNRYLSYIHLCINNSILKIIQNFNIYSETVLFNFFFFKIYLGIRIC